MKRLFCLLVLASPAFADSVSINSGTYSNPSIGASVTYNVGSMTGMYLVAAPRYYSESVGYINDSQVQISFRMVNGADTVTMTGNAPAGNPPAGFILVGWEIQVYLIRGGSIIGWSDEVNVPKS